MFAKTSAAYKLGMDPLLMNLIEEMATAYSGGAMAAWKKDNLTYEAPANKELLNRDLFLADRYRIPHSYPKQRNQHGFYLFSQTFTHIWHESRFESHMLTLLDFTQNIVAIASQPVELTFADGGRHTPDYLALLADGRQVLYDVRPRRLVGDAALVQFAKTEAVCDTVGWRYVVLTELAPIEKANLVFLRHFAHPLFMPPEEAVRTLLEGFDDPLGFLEAASLLGLESVAHGRSALLHLLWKRVVAIDLTERINDRTPVRRMSNVVN